MEDLSTMSGFEALLANIEGGQTAPETETETTETQTVEQGEETTDVETTTQPEPDTTANIETEENPNNTVPRESNTTSQRQSTGKLPNAAFAELRVKNKEATEALELICAKAGLDPSLARNPKAILEMLEDADTAEQANSMNVPPALLKKINELEKKEQERESQRLYDQALNGFNTVKSKYNLSDSEVLEFSKQLQEKGLDPFKKPLDLEREYCLMNLHKILEKERKAGYAEAMAINKKAAQHSTTPATVVGKKDEPMDSKITTMAQFDKFLTSLTK